MKKNIMYLFLLIFLFNGCSSIREKVVAVDSYSAYESQGGTYFLKTSTKGIELQQKSFEREIEKKLLEHGYTRIYNKEISDYNILYNYGVKGPFTYLSLYPVPVNSWWSNDRFYDGVYNGYYEASWVNSIETQNYYVKNIELTASNSNNAIIWQIFGTMKSKQHDMRDSMIFLLRGIDKYIGKNSKKVQYINVKEE